MPPRLKGVVLPHRAEFFHRVFERPRTQAGKIGVLRDGELQKVLRDVLFKARKHVFARQPPAFERVGDKTQPQRAQF